VDALPATAIPRVRTETLVAIACCAAAALWIDLGGIHRMEDGDSMLPVLISLQKWTPFYWEQDRFGMLVPLLVMPFKDPVVNLLVQRGIYLFAGQCTLLAGARWAFGPERWQLPGALAVALWLGLAPYDKTFHYLGHHPYALSLLLGFGALVVFGAEGRRAWRWPLAGALMFLGHWVNAALFTFLVPAALARAAAVAVGEAGGARRAALLRGAREAGLSLLVGVAASPLSRLSTVGERSVALEFLPAAEWPVSWATLWHNLVFREMSPQSLIWTCLAFAAAGLVAMAVSARWRRAAWEPARIGAGLLLAGAAYFLLVGTQAHVKGNLYHSRYLDPTLALTQLSLLAPLAVPAARALSARAFRAACALLGMLAVAGAAFTFGPPAPGKIRGLLEAASPLTPEVVSLHCTHVAGNYWKVWPAVVMANEALHQRGEDRQVWGVSHRAFPTLEQATAMPPDRVRIAVGLDDPEPGFWMRRYGFPSKLVLLERGEKIAVLGIEGPR
jgi:hypothetical protein